MKRITTALVALAVGALAAFAPAATATASATPSTPARPTATLAGSAACVGGGWKATYVFTNRSPRHTAVITTVKGDLSPEVPVRVEPGDTLTGTTALLTGRVSWVEVRYRWETVKPTASPTASPTVVPTTVPPVVVPEAVVLTRTEPKGEKTLKLRAEVRRCFCPTTPPTTHPTSTPPTTTPTTQPTSASPSPSRTTITPTTVPTTAPTQTEPPILGGPASGGGALPLTGAPVMWAAAAGVVLLAGGVLALVLVRRRRTSFTT